MTRFVRYAFLLLFVLCSANLKSEQDSKTLIQKLNNNVSEHRILGLAQAEDSLYLLFDIDCGACQFAFSELVPKIKKDFIDTNKLKLVLIDYPFSLSKKRLVQSQLALCASEQAENTRGELYTEFVSYFFSTSKEVSKTATLEYAEKFSLDYKALVACVKSKKYLSYVLSNHNIAKSMGVDGVPAFYFNEEYIGAASLYEGFKVLLQGMLRK